MRVETHRSSFFFSVESSPPIPRDCLTVDWLWLSEMKARWQTHLCDYDWLDGRDRPKTKKANLPPGLLSFGLEQWLLESFSCLETKDGPSEDDDGGSLYYVAKRRLFLSFFPAELSCNDFSLTHELSLSPTSTAPAWLLSVHYGESTTPTTSWERDALSA